MRMPRQQEVTDKNLQISTSIFQYCMQNNKKNPNEEFFLLNQMIPSISTGITWRIITANYPEWKQIDAWYNKINKEIDHWHCYRIQSGKGERVAYLIEVDGEYLEKIMDATMPADIWTDEQKEEISKYRQWAILQLYQDLTESKKKGSQIVCIYNQNKNNQVVNQPAYAVTLAECAYICQRAGYFFVAKGVGGDYEGMRFSPSEVVKENREAFVTKFMETLKYTPGGNAIQIQVCAMLDKEADKFAKNGALR